jgi:hypothetical protein
MLLLWDHMSNLLTGIGGDRPDTVGDAKPSFFLRPLFIPAS